MGMNLSLGAVTLSDGQRVTGDWPDALAMEQKMCLYGALKRTHFFQQTVHQLEAIKSNALSRRSVMSQYLQTMALSDGWHTVGIELGTLARHNQHSNVVLSRAQAQVLECKVQTHCVATLPDINRARAIPAHVELLDARRAYWNWAIREAIGRGLSCCEKPFLSTMSLHDVIPRCLSSLSIRKVSTLRAFPLHSISSYPRCTCSLSLVL